MSGRGENWIEASSASLDYSDMTDVLLHAPLHLEPGSGRGAVVFPATDDGYGLRAARSRRAETEWADNVFEPQYDEAMEVA